MLALADDYLKKTSGRGLRPGKGMYTGPAYDDFLPNGLVCSNVPDVAARQLGFLYPYFINVPFRRLFNINEIDYRYINSRLSLENPDTMFLFSVFFKDVSDYMRYMEKNWRELADDIEKGTISPLAKASAETKELIEKVLVPKPDRALREINPRYGYFVDLNKIGRIEVGNLRFGTSKEWMKERIRRGAPGTQVKPVRILDTPEKEEFFLPETVSSAE